MMTKKPERLPKSLPPLILQFGEKGTRYKGDKMKLATVFIHGVEHIVSMSDTYLCSNDLGAARRTLVNLGARGTDAELDTAAAQFQAKCRELSKWKEQKDVKRDVPKVRARVVNLSTRGL